MRCIRGGRVTGPGAPPATSPPGAELQAMQEGLGVQGGPEPEAGPSAPRWALQGRPRPSSAPGWL